MTEILPNRDWLAELASLDEAADFLKLAKQAPIELQSQIIALAGESFEGGEALAKALFKNPPPKVKQKPIQVIQQPAEVEIPRRTLADLTKAKPIPPTPKPLKLRQWSEVKVPDGVTELERLTYVPGLVGDITDWIVSGARRPNRLMAFGVALAIGGTLISRRIMGPTESATHLYVIIIGRSGRGKDWPLQCGERLMTELDLGDLVGPGEWASSPGLWLRLKRNPVLICFVDELGDELALVNGQNGNPFVSKIIGTLKKCYNAFSIQHTAEKVSAESDKIVWPAPSIVGAATVQKFFSSLTPSDLESGFANRLYVIPSDVRTSGECQPPRGTDEPPAQLVADLKTLYRPVSQLDLPTSRIPPNRELIDWGEGAENVYFSHSRAIDTLEDTDPKRHRLGLRSCENAVRIATIISVLRGSPTVNIEDINVAIALGNKSLDTTCSNAEKFIKEYYEFPDYCDHVCSTLALCRLSLSAYQRKFGRNQRWGGMLDKVTDQLLREKRIRKACWQEKKGPEIEGWEVVPDAEDE